VRIYYYHSLDLTFKSAQTIQVIKDYCGLSKNGHEVFLYGQYSCIKEWVEVASFIEKISVFVSARPRSKLNRVLGKVVFIFKMLLDKEKVIVTRDVNKAKSMLFFRKLMRAKVIHEMHEESFTYLFKKRITKESVQNTLSSVDAILFTNQSQVTFYQKEFGLLPNCYVVLPNGVEENKFENASRKNNYVLTYLGQFNRWKNIELIFSSLALLDEKFTLRVAGGKGRESDRDYIDGLIKRYKIAEKRVNFLGYVNNSEIVEGVLSGSNVLLLPLGNNIQSKYLTSPMKLFEYMSTKIPIVSVDYPSITSFVDDEVVFLSDNNPESFSAAIKECVKSSDLEERILEMNLRVKKLSYKVRSERYDDFICQFDK